MNKNRKISCQLIVGLVVVGLFAYGNTLHAENPVERQHLGDWEKDLGYTQTIKVGETLYLSGITSGAPTMAEQITDIYTTIQSILAGYNVSTDKIIKETIYTVDIDALKQHAQHRKQFYKDGLYPAATWVQVERLFLPEVLLEVEVMVHLSDE